MTQADHAVVPEALDLLMPMHLILTPGGLIGHCGPTLRKMAQGGDLTGHDFLDVFHLRRPRNATGFADLRAAGPAALRLTLRQGSHVPLKGMLVPLPKGGALVNLSCGISVVEAVARYKLTDRDFAATDLAVEMLYLVEANAAAMEESRSLNLRLQGAKIAAEEQAYTDTLTGLKNRRAMAHVIGRLIATAQPFALLQIDLDFFKDVNDSLGHAAGDWVLQEVARLLVEETRLEDTVVRIGGDEFVVVVHGSPDPTYLGLMARRIIDRLERPIPFEGEVCRISGSIGIAMSDDYPCPDMDRILADADAALYASKNGGRGQAQFYATSVTELATADRRARTEPPMARHA